MYLVTVQVKKGGLVNLQVLRKVISISGKYVKEIQDSHKLGYPAPEGSLNFVFTYENKVFCLSSSLTYLRADSTSCN